MTIRHCTNPTGCAPPLTNSERQAGFRSSRRPLLAAGAVTAAALGTRARQMPAQTQNYDLPTTWRSPEGRLVRPITYGITPAELQRAQSLGFAGYRDILAEIVQNRLENPNLDLVPATPRRSVA